MSKSFLVPPPPAKPSCATIKIALLLVLANSSCWNVISSPTLLPYAIKLIGWGEIQLWKKNWKTPRRKLTDNVSGKIPVHTNAFLHLSLSETPLWLESEICCRKLLMPCVRRTIIASGDGTASIVLVAYKRSSIFVLEGKCSMTISLPTPFHQGCCACCAQKTVIWCQSLSSHPSLMMLTTNSSFLQSCLNKILQLHIALPTATMSPVNCIVGGCESKSTMSCRIAISSCSFPMSSYMLLLKFLYQTFDRCFIAIICNPCLIFDECNYAMDILLMIVSWWKSKFQHLRMKVFIICCVDDL